MRLHHSPLIYLAIFCMLGAVISQDASQDTNTEAYAFNYLIKLSEMHFEGQWHSTSGTKQFGSYEESSGFMFSDTYNSCTIPGSGFTVAMLIYDGQYVNTDGFKVSLCHMFSPSFRFDSANAALIGTDVALKIDTSKVFFTAEQIPSHECPADISIHFIDRTSNQPLTGLTNIDERASDIGVQFFVSSPKCHISFTTDVLTPSQRTNIYSEIFISVVYAALVLYEARYLWDKKNVQSSQLSIMSFSWRIICGGMLAFTNLSLVARGASTLFLISIAITVLETFMFYIVIDKETTKIKSYIFSCLPFIAAIWIFGMYFNTEWAYIAASFYLMPQIIGLYKSGERRKFSMKLIYIPLLPQIFLLAYLYLNPYNMARQRPNVLFFFAYAGLVAIQVFIIRFQGKGRRPKYQPQENEMGPIASEGVESA